jgi:type I restriction enzyme, S subunit
VTTWKTVELGDVAEFVRGITFKPDDVVPVGTSGSVVCMRTKNVQSELDCSDVWGVDERFVRREDQFLAPGDILVSTANSWNLVGKCCWVPGLPWRATFGGFVSVLRSDRAKAEPRFLFRWFSSDRIQMTLRSFGQQTTNISNLNTDRCLKLPLPLPPLNEQRRIADVLDRAEALRAKRRALLAQLDALAQSIFLDLFGDPTLPEPTIGDLLESGSLLLHKDGNHGSRYPRAEDFGDEGVPFLSARAVTDDGAIDNTLVENLREEKAANLTIGWISKGDVLLAHNASVGKVAVYDGRFERALIGTSLTAFRPNPDALDSLYLSAALGSVRFQRQLEKNMGQTTRNQVPITAQRRLRIPEPPISLQREFGCRIGAVERLKATYRASLVKLDALFASLQYLAFRGEL